MNGDEDTRLEPGEDSGSAPAGQWPSIEGYRIERLLGTGGMGEVYLAEQLEPVQRDVALKIISEERSRGLGGAMFEVERQILAHLSHPAVAQIFDAGSTSDGRPFFAMEWVQGEPIDRFCQSAELTRRKRLELFIRVCQGVEHAHRRGVIHRDLKPANVLVRNVDATALPKIIDFGIAASVFEQDGRMRSSRSDRAGTRAYMSPEQRDGDAEGLDSRTDVYALGLLLFELLTDQRPGIDENPATLYRFREALLNPGSSPGTNDAGDIDGANFSFAVAKAQSLPRELRFIIARALAEDREQRYASAAELAHDLRNFMDNRVVSAVPDSRAYRLRKFVLRHRLPVAAGTAVLLSLVVGLTVAVWGLLQAQDQRDAARAQLARAEVSAEFVTRMLSSINPESADGADTTLLRRILDDAAARAPETLADYPEILAEIELTLGRAYNSIGEFETARDHLHNAISRSAQNPATRRIWLGARNSLAYNHYLVDQNEASLEISAQLLPIARRELDPDEALRMEIISQAAAASRLSGRPEKALALSMEVVDATEDAVDPVLIANRLEALRAAAQAHSDANRLAQADALFTQVLREAEAWNDPEARWHALTTLNDLAVARLRDQRYAEAEPMLRESLARAEALFGPDDRRLISVSSNLASCLRQQGKLEESLPWFDRARSLTTRHLGEDHFNQSILDYNEGNAYRELGRVGEALELQRPVLARALERMPDQTGVLAEFRLGLGETELAAGNAGTASELLHKALQYFDAERGADHYRTLAAASALIQARRQLGQHALADELARRYPRTQLQ